MLIRALASARQMQAGETRLSTREGADEEFDPARQAQYAFEAERLHHGVVSESLISALLEGGAEGGDVLDLARSEEDRRLLASVLMHEEEELTPETVEGAIRGLRRIGLRRRLEDVQRSLVRPGLSRDDQHGLFQERVRLKRALADPGLDETAGRAS